MAISPEVELLLSQSCLAEWLAGKLLKLPAVQASKYPTTVNSVYQFGSNSQRAREVQSGV